MLNVTNIERTHTWAFLVAQSCSLLCCRCCSWGYSCECTRTWAFLVAQSYERQLVVAKAKGGAGLTMQLSFIYKLTISCYLQVTILKHKCLVVKC